MNIEELDFLWLGLGLLFIVLAGVGLLNNKIPVIPFAYLSLLMLQLMTDPPFSVELLLILFFIGILVMVIDYQSLTLSERKPWIYVVIRSFKIVFYFLLLALFTYGTLR